MGIKTSENETINKEKKNEINLRSSMLLKSRKNFLIFPARYRKPEGWCEMKITLILRFRDYITNAINNECKRKNINVCNVKRFKIN